jgi:putative ABC transport system permease protein
VRQKEIGMRKVLGSEKNQLVFQFLAEALISTVFAMLVAAFIFYLAIPFFNEISGKTYAFSKLLAPEIILA